MTLVEKFDRIVARAEELRAALSESLTGEAFSRASRELSELEPVVARIEELRSAEAEAEDAEQMLADPEMRDLAEQELHRLREKLPALQSFSKPIRSMPVRRAGNSASWNSASRSSAA
jgi:peptide chain release factor 1